MSKEDLTEEGTVEMTVESGEGANHAELGEHSRWGIAIAKVQGYQV